jgi:hypothetical protein
MIAEIQQSTGHSIRVICRVLGVPRSSYYQAAEPSARARRDQELGVESSKASSNTTADATATVGSTPSWWIAESAAPPPAYEGS